MHKVYVVMWVFESIPCCVEVVEQQIEKIFFTEDKANEWVAKQITDDGVTYEVQEWEVE